MGYCLPWSAPEQGLGSVPSFSIQQLNGLRIGNTRVIAGRSGGKSLFGHQGQKRGPFRLVDTIGFRRRNVQIVIDLAQRFQELDPDRHGWLRPYRPARVGAWRRNVREVMRKSEVPVLMGH